MKSKNELFIEAVDYLIDEGLATDSSDVAQKAGLGPNLISRVRTGKVKSVSDDSIRALASKFNLNMDYFRGKSEHITRHDKSFENTEQENNSQQSKIPDFIQKLFDEAVRMQTRNEMLERQCENLIAELRDSKDEHDKFMAELKQSKEFNDALAAELKISRTQNENLISELRETKKNNAMLSTKLQSAIDGIESMKAQLAMMAGAYTAAQSSAFTPTFVNDDPSSIEPVIKFPIPNSLSGKKGVRVDVIPEGLIRGGYTAITDELAATVAQLLNKSKSKSKRK